MAHFSHAIMQQVHQIAGILHQMEATYHDLSIVLAKRIKTLGEETIRNLHKQGYANFFFGAVGAGCSFTPLLMPGAQAQAEAWGKVVQAGDRVLGTVLNASHTKLQLDHNLAKDVELQRAMKLQEELRNKHNELQGLLREAIQQESGAFKVIV